MANAVVGKLDQLYRIIAVRPVKHMYRAELTLYYSIYSSEIHVCC